MTSVKKCHKSSTHQLEVDKICDNNKEHACRTCGKTFSRRNYLYIHEKIHGERNYKCPICGRAFRQPAGLWTHKRSKVCLKSSVRNSAENIPSSGSGEKQTVIEQGGKQYRRKACERTITQKHLLTSHEKNHTAEYFYPCPECGKLFRSAVTLKLHLKEHDERKMHKCIFCTKVFTQISALKRHCLKVHESEDVYQCEVCSTTFSRFRQLTDHHLRHPNMANVPGGAVSCTRHEESNVTSTQIVNNRLEIPDNSNTDMLSINSITSQNTLCATRSGSICADQRSEDVSCAVVDGEPCSLTSQGDSQRSFNVDISAKCVLQIGESQSEDCDEIAPGKKGKKLHQCDNCGKVFSQPYALKYHKRIHTGEKPHPCNFCHKSFRTPGTLHVHQRIHNGEKPYRCLFCKQTFNQRISLLQHCTRKHGSRKIYECEICEDKFEKYSALSFHRYDAHSKVRTRAHSSISNDEKEVGEFKCSFGVMTMTETGDNNSDSRLNSYDTPSVSLKSVQNSENVCSKGSPESSASLSGDCSLTFSGDSIPSSPKANEYNCTSDEEPNFKSDDQTLSSQVADEGGHSAVLLIKNDDARRDDVFSAVGRSTAVAHVKRENEDNRFFTTLTFNDEIAYDDCESDLLYEVVMQPPNMEFLESKDSCLSASVWHPPSSSEKERKILSLGNGIMNHLCCCLEEQGSLVETCSEVYFKGKFRKLEDSSLQEICFKCDVLPATWHLVST